MALAVGCPHTSCHLLRNPAPIRLDLILSFVRVLRLLSLNIFVIPAAFKSLHTARNERWSLLAEAASPPLQLSTLQNVPSHLRFLLRTSNTSVIFQHHTFQQNPISEDYDCLGAETTVSDEKKDTLFIVCNTEHLIGAEPTDSNSRNVLDTDGF